MKMRLGVCCATAVAAVGAAKAANLAVGGDFTAAKVRPGLRFCLAHISWPWCDERWRENF